MEPTKRIVKERYEYALYGTRGYMTVEVRSSVDEMSDSVKWENAEISWNVLRATKADTCELLVPMLVAAIGAAKEMDKRHGLD